MFGKVKKWLGIEGVKLELVLPDYAFREVGALSGKVRFFSQTPQRVTSVKIELIERYKRGRGAEKLIDEYELGKITLAEPFDVPERTPVEVEFTLPFSLLKSEMDALEEKNILTGGLVKVAKLIQNVKSEFYVLAEAKVEGTALNPFDKKQIEMK
ncbi:MAG: hypothetical protein D6714_08075 [Bacteroidetes bacterium]|nr:MAG: hypothetical protein D6714_08075 [Bacteroidota bacterium]